MSPSLVIFWMVVSQQDYQNSFSDYRIPNQQNMRLCCVLKIGRHESGLVVLARVIFFFLICKIVRIWPVLGKKESVLQKHFSACCFSIALPLWFKTTWLMILNYKGLVTCQWQIEMRGSWASRSLQLPGVAFSVAIHSQDSTFFQMLLNTLR